MSCNIVFSLFFTAFVLRPTCIFIRRNVSSWPGDIGDVRPQH